MFDVFVDNLKVHSCKTLSGAKRAAASRGLIPSERKVEIAETGEGYWQDRLIKMWRHTVTDHVGSWQIVPFE